MKKSQGTLTESGNPGRQRRVVLDSFAWIEYFSGSTAGQKVRELLETRTALTPAIVVAELSEKYCRLNLDFGSRFDFVMGRSSVLPLEEELARAAGEVNYARKKIMKGWGMADSIVLTTARRSQAKIVTGDPHFRDLEEEVIRI